MKSSDITHLTITCGGKTILEPVATHIKEGISFIIERIQSSWNKGDDELVIRFSHKPFDDSIDPATGLNKAALEESYKRNAGMNPLPNESREDYVARLVEYEGQTQSRAEGWADAFGFTDDGLKAKWDSDPQAQRWFNHQTPKAWASLTPGEQSELKRHMDIHWTGSRFWDGIHRFD